MNSVLLGRYLWFGAMLRYSMQKLFEVILHVLIVWVFYGWLNADIFVEPLTDKNLGIAVRDASWVRHQCLHQLNIYREVSHSEARDRLPRF